jgi:SAM-dependent methyltransferase
VLGVDISAPLLEHARRLTAAARQGNVTYQQGDAQVHRFAAGHHDVAISRFGAMFFADPIAAFENIGEALRRGGRLVLLVWQDTRTALAGLDRASAARVEERLRDTLAAHRRGERGVLFDSRAWIITATW